MKGKKVRITRFENRSGNVFPIRYAMAMRLEYWNSGIPRAAMTRKKNPPRRANHDKLRRSDPPHHPKEVTMATKSRMEPPASQPKPCRLAIRRAPWRMLFIDAMRRFFAISMVLLWEWGVIIYKHMGKTRGVFLPRTHMEFIMSIEKELTSRMKEAMRSKDAAVLSVLRMVKSEGQIAKTSAGFKGETDDSFWSDVILRYVKKQKKAKAEFEKAGESGQASAESLQFEIDYLTPFLPKMMSEDEVREIVKKAIEETGASGPNMVGKVMGFVMKSHKGQVDAAAVKSIATVELSQ